MFYSAPYTFDFGAQRIRVDVGSTEVDVPGLYTAIKLAQSNVEGILYPRIGSGAGLADLGGGIRVGLTVELLGSWQVEFPAGNYIARVTSGNLVGGPGGDPIAYSAGVQTLLIQSAASTVVEVTAGGSAPTAAQNAAAVWQRAVEAGYTAEQLLRLLAAQAAGDAAGLDSASVTFKSLDGTKDRIVGTVAGGARTVTTRDGS